MGVTNFVMSATCPLEDHVISHTPNIHNASIMATGINLVKKFLSFTFI